MRTCPAEPSPGDRISASWMRDLVRYIRSIAPVAGPGIKTRATPNGTHLSCDTAVARQKATAPHPYEVRWDGSLDDGAGGWKIYLPTEHLLSYGGANVATSDIGGVTCIEDADGNDTPWFSFDEIGTSADHVWLVVTVEKSAGEVVSIDAEFADEEGEDESEGEGEETETEIVNVCIAELEYTAPEDEGSPPTVKVVQSVVGAVRLGGGSSGPTPDGVTPDGASTEFIPHDSTQGADNTHEGELQVKGFRSGTPASSTTVATELVGTGASSGAVLFREANGSLSYKPLGKLALTFDFVADFQYSNHKLQKKFGHVANGVVTVDDFWTDVTEAVPHSGTVSSGSGGAS